MYITCDIDYLYGDANSSLGNILFLIASTYGIANKNNMIVKIKSLEIFYKKWKDIYRGTIFRNIDTEKLDIIKKVYEIRKHRNTYNSDYFKVTDGSCLVGYFQSYKYFNDYKDVIYNLFSIDDVTKEYIENKYRNILENKTTSIHIRRGDFCNLNCVLDMKYYHNAIEKFEKDMIYLIFSDDINWCKENFKINNAIYVENEHDYIDLYIMSMCKNNIIANSTFSWWGAYLNKNEKKMVIYPVNFFENYELKDKKKVMNDFFPKEWIGI